MPVPVCRLKVCDGQDGRPDATNLRTKRRAGSACGRAHMHGPFLFEKSLLIPPSHRIMSDAPLRRLAAGSRERGTSRAGGRKRMLEWFHVAVFVC